MILGDGSIPKKCDLSRFFGIGYVIIGIRRNYGN